MTAYTEQNGAEAVQLGRGDGVDLTQTRYPLFNIDKRVIPAMLDFVAKDEVHPSLGFIRVQRVRKPGHESINDRVELQRLYDADALYTGMTELAASDGHMAVKVYLDGAAFHWYCDYMVESFLMLPDKGFNTYMGKAADRQVYTDSSMYAVFSDDPIIQYNGPTFPDIERIMPPLSHVVKYPVGLCGDFCGTLLGRLDNILAANDFGKHTMKRFRFYYPKPTSMDEDPRCKVHFAVNDRETFYAAMMPILSKSAEKGELGGDVYSSLLDPIELPETSSAA